jgi:hypothetical protein
MDSVAKMGILRELKTRYKIEMHPTTLDLCEKAARNIVSKSNIRRKPLDLKRRHSEGAADTCFHAKAITDAVNSISNQNGGTQAAVPVFVIALVVVVLMLIFLDKYNGWDRITEMVKHFDLP